MGDEEFIRWLRNGRLPLYAELRPLNQDAEPETDLTFTALDRYEIPATDRINFFYVKEPNADLWAHPPALKALELQGWRVVSSTGGATGRPTYILIYDPTNADLA